ncbi:hypothetical protein [Clostridium grantii]|uniref:Uncharacterized protein n=1 Tax=Clostridium grantii DSM 8605 TaxID=1121316 RepID=A0A1M5RNY7_9CLOT|nr:hypothetical protein [Clostridium grantii]SHH27861.1 hypothetical protein SAMN02745207_00632 [Clostridium grantii DSM 8605]
MNDKYNETMRFSISEERNCEINSEASYFDYIRELKSNRDEINECEDEYNIAFMTL